MRAVHDDEGLHQRKKCFTPSHWIGLSHTFLRAYIHNDLLSCPFRYLHVYVEDMDWCSYPSANAHNPLGTPSLKTGS
ncbi:hypothetical protein KP509_23G010500 [Ceratopteris richardii]|uniref:Uncharacterized protein n=1 Tax=Ceratopteris richardii TaxID=49495 RepID=A0A8T2RYY3_CERRI|nr:hypothetical protein KP509_23G010500 [Ceratopteris richardii]